MSHKQRTRGERRGPGIEAAAAQAKTKLLVATPAYGGMVHVDYVRALFGFAAAGIDFELSTIGNESLITRARNSLLAVFHATPGFTHLLFLDADVHLPAEDLKRMLAAGAAVIGAPVALKGRSDAGDRRWNLGRCLGSSGSLLAVEHVGTAVLMLSRAAVQALVDDAIADGRTYAPPSSALVGSAAAAAIDIHYDVFRVGVRDGIYLSEDYWVCQRLIALGFQILIDPTAVTTHWGTISA